MVKFGSFLYSLARILYVRPASFLGWLSFQWLRATSALGRTGVNIMMRHGGEQAVLENLNRALNKLGIKVETPRMALERDLEKLAKVASEDPEITRWSN